MILAYGTIHGTVTALTISGLKKGDKVLCRMDYENLDGGIVLDEVKTVTDIHKSHIIVDGWMRFESDGWSESKTCCILRKA